MKVGDLVAYQGVQYTIEKDYGNNVFLLGNQGAFVDMVSEAQLTLMKKKFWFYCYPDDPEETEVMYAVSPVATRKWNSFKEIEENQEEFWKPHREIEKEFLEILKQHGIECDEGFVANRGKLREILTNLGWKEEFIPFGP